MKVLIVNTSEQTGGAAVASNRLLAALNNNGVKARMLVRDKQTDDLRVTKLRNDALMRWRFAWERFRIFRHLGFSRQRLWEIDIACSGADITKTREFREADVIHLEWINQGMISLGGIKKILKSGKPVVWTMHDLWPAASVCHYARGCKGFMKDCSCCSLLPANSRLSNRVWRRKAEAYSAGRIRFVTCSHWLESQARQSALLENADIKTIPNPIDTNVFRPMDKLEARNALGLPSDKKVILFVSQKLTDERKGARYLVQALHQFQESALAGNCVVALLGARSEELAAEIPLPVFPLGYKSGDDSLSRVYNAADVFVLPSMEDNLPNTIMEALACGVPCVGFNVGGIPEMIDHLCNGYVAKAADSEDLAKGLEWVLANSETESLAQEAANKAVRCYSQQSVAAKYLNLYLEASKPQIFGSQNQEIRITVITCTYNAEAVLERTLQSVMQQTHRNVEHLIIDGCSKDSTVAMATHYKRLSDEAANGHVVKIVSEPDRGLYDAMNKALALATGHYLVYLNAGDKFADAETLASVCASVSYGERLPGVIYGDTDIVGDDGQFLRHRRLHPREEMSWRDFRHGMLICHQSFYALTSIARALPYNNLRYRYSADVDWCIRVMKQSENEARKLRYCPRVLTQYLDGGMSIQNHRASLKERFAVMRSHYGLLPTVLQHLWFAIRLLIKK